MLTKFYLQSLAHFEFDGDNRKKDIARSLKALVPGAPRRIDPFIQVSLMGAAQCLEGLAASRCDVYVTASVTSNHIMADLLQTVIVEKEQPKPMSFIHSIGNAAPFYIAQHFQLKGEAFFISENEQQLAELLSLAALRLNQSSQGVLLGHIAESDDQITAKWMLLSKDRDSQTIAEIKLVSNALGKDSTVCEQLAQLESMLSRNDSLHVTGDRFNHATAKAWMLSKQ